MLTLPLPLQRLLLLLLLLAAFIACQLAIPIAATASAEPTLSPGKDSNHSSSGGNHSSESHEAHQCVMGPLICIHDDLKPFLLTALWLLFLVVLLLVFERSEHPQHHQHHPHPAIDLTSVASSDWGPLGRARRFCNKVLVHYIREYLPTSCLQILLGLAFATGFLISGYHVAHLESLNPGLFFHFLLPIIIINAGLGVEKRYFYFNLPAILVYAVFGTIIVALSIGYALYGMASMNPGPFTTLKNLTKVEALTFGALISAVDPVAVLAVFERMHLNKPMYMTLFGESVLNDAVSVVLYNMFTNAKASMVSSGKDEWYPDALEIGGVAVYSIHVAVSGFIIGVACALLASGLIRILPNAGNQNLAVLIVVISGYLSFYLAELIAASGILSTFVCSIVMSIYLANLTPISQSFLYQSTKSYAEISEGFVYLVMGVSAVRLFSENSSRVVVDVPFVFITLALCTVLRFACVYGMGYLLKLGSLTDLKASDFFILSYGGLRGAIALALSLMLDPAHFTYGDQFFACTMLMVLLTCFVNGITLKPLIQVAKIKIDETVADSLWSQIMNRTCDCIGFYMGTLTGHQPLMTQVYIGFNRVNDKYVRRALLKSKVYNEAQDEGIYELHRKIVADEFLKYATESKSLIDLNALRADSMVYAIRRVSSMGHLLPHSGSQQRNLGPLPASVRRALSVGQTLEELDLEGYQEPCDPVLDMEALSSNAAKAERDRDDQQNHHRHFMRDARIINPRSWQDMRTVGSAGALSNHSDGGREAESSLQKRTASSGALVARTDSAATSSSTGHHHHHHQHQQHLGANPKVKFSINTTFEDDDKEDAEEKEKEEQNDDAASSASSSASDRSASEENAYASRYYAHHPHLIQLPKNRRTSDDLSVIMKKFSDPAMQEQGDSSNLPKKKSVSFATLSPDEGVLDPRQRATSPTEATPAAVPTALPQPHTHGRFLISVCSEAELHRSQNSMPSVPDIRIDDTETAQPAEEFNYEVNILNSLPWSRKSASELPNEEHHNNHKYGRNVSFGGTFYVNEGFDDSSV